MDFRSLLIILLVYKADRERIVIVYLSASSTVIPYEVI